MSYDEAFQAQQILEMNGFKASIKVPIWARMRNRDEAGKLLYDDYFLDLGNGASIRSEEDLKRWLA